MLTTALIPEDWWPFVILCLGPLLAGLLLLVGLIVRWMDAHKGRTQEPHDTEGKP